MEYRAQYMNIKYVHKSINHTFCITCEHLLFMRKFKNYRRSSAKVSGLDIQSPLNFLILQFVSGSLPQSSVISCQESHSLLGIT